MYGLHAVGFSHEVLRRLDGYDARALRGIASAPVHLTHENNVSLRKRLGVASPAESLKATLERRTLNSSQTDSCGWFRETLTQMQAAQDSASITQLDTADLQSWGVPCDICGQYFSNHRHMRSHRTRKHQKPPQASTIPTSRDGTMSKTQMSGVLSTRAYREYAVDGMPACRFCKVRFTRVEGLKKHIRRGCPKFGCPHPSPEEDQPGVVTAPEVQVASGQGELNRQSALQITPEDPAEQPLIHNLSFRSSLQISWRQPLRDPAFRKKMSTYCVLCGQWISNVGPGCKQHLRLMHAAEWTHSSAALARITSLGLDTASPCTYCGKQAKDIRKHLRGCVPVSQPSLAALVVIAQERAVGAPDVERDGAGGKGHPGQAGDRTGLLDQPPEEKDDSAEGRPPKWYRQNQGKGHSQDGWQKWKSQKRGWEPAENAHQARSSGQAMDEKVQGLLTTLTCAVLRHETDLQLWRADTSFVIYVDICPHSCLQSIRDAAANWEELFANGKVTIMALKTALTMGIMNKLKEQMEALQLDEAKMQKCREAGWMGEGRQALDPAWFYHGTGGPPLAHHDPEGPRPGHPLPLDGRHPFALQVYEDTERGSGGRGRAIHADDQYEDPGGRRPAPYLQKSGRMRQLQAFGAACQAGEGPTQPVEQAARAELPEPGLLRMEARNEQSPLAQRPINNVLILGLLVAVAVGGGGGRRWRVCRREGSIDFKPAMCQTSSSSTLRLGQTFCEVAFVAVCTLFPAVFLKSREFLHICKPFVPMLAVVSACSFEVGGGLLFGFLARIRGEDGGVMTSMAMWMMYVLCFILLPCRGSGGIGGDDVHGSCGVMEAWTIFTISESLGRFLLAAMSFLALYFRYDDFLC